MERSDRAVELFGKGYNCSQAVLGACGPELGLPLESCLALASAFGGGMCRQAQTCGAVTGALLALGLARGQVTVDEPKRKGEVYEAGQSLMASFRERHGSIVCRELLGCDISTKEGMARAHELGVLGSVCPELVRTAANLVPPASPSGQERLVEGRS